MDRQIFLNYLFVFFFPLLFGGAIRFLCRRFSKAWLITVLAAVQAIAAWMIALHPPVLGSELYGLRAIHMVCFTIGSLLVGLFIRRRK